MAMTSSHGHKVKPICFQGLFQRQLSHCWQVCQPALNWTTPNICGPLRNVNRGPYGPSALVSLSCVGTAPIQGLWILPIEPFARNLPFQRVQPSYAALLYSKLRTPSLCRRLLQYTRVHVHVLKVTPWLSVAESRHGLQVSQTTKIRLGLARSKALSNRSSERWFVGWLWLGICPSAQNSFTAKGPSLRATALLYTHGTA